MNVNRLKAKLVEKGFSVERLAEAIGMKRSTLYRKLNNFEKITIEEAQKIKIALGLTDEEAVYIFLG